MGIDAFLMVKDSAGAFPGDALHIFWVRGRARGRVSIFQILV